MNGLSFSELCCLFCCPPCPGRIASKLAFLPPEASYDLKPEAESANSKFTLTLYDKADWQYSDREKECLEAFYARSSRGNRIACLFVKCSANARFTLLFSHGNAVDLGQMTTFFIGLGQRINCNIFSYDYSGYGQSTGKPTEKNLYADIDAAWHALRTRFGISPENIILYGQSIGTVPTVDLASRYEVGAVILHSPLMSGMRVAFPATKRTWFFDAFPSIDKVPKVTSPVLVIHGTEDEVIDFSHGMTIYEKCPRAVEPLWVEGAGHNDVEMYSQYLERLKQFVSVNKRAGGSGGKRSKGDGTGTEGKDEGDNAEDEEDEDLNTGARTGQWKHQGPDGVSESDLVASVAPNADPAARSEGDGRDTTDEQQQQKQQREPPTPDATGFATSSDSNTNKMHDPSSGDGASTIAGSTKATVHINGVAVDHFHQNSDVDEERRSLCQNSDIHGFISYSSDSSMIELNLKFRKCACNENIINISKENLQQMQRTSPPGTATSGDAGDGQSMPPGTGGVFKKEGKSKKLLALNKDNLNSLVRKLNDTSNSSSSSCTKCRLSLDVNHILKQIVSIKSKSGGGEDAVDAVVGGKHCEGASRSPRDDSCSRHSALPLIIDDDSMIGLRADDSLIGSSASPLPSPNSPIPVLGLPPLERRHSETVERRSIGVQHAGSRPPYRKKPPLLRAHGRGMAQAEEIIIISDEFRRQSLRDQQSVRVQKSGKKISKSMESIDKRNHPPALSLRPVAIRSFHLPHSSVDGELDQADEVLTIVVDTACDRDAGNGKPTVKSISKSVDNISLGSGNEEVEIFPHQKTPEGRSPGAGDDSVELIFISDEFVKRKSKSSSDVIIVENAGHRRESKRRKPVKHLSVGGGGEAANVERKKLSVARRPSSTEGRIVKSATIPAVAGSSPAGKAKDPRRKTTISSSNSFLTYEEPFSPETLENKDIGQMFADASNEQGILRSADQGAQ
ncbi:hypothetical protein ZHAS_00013915 [Anopheles sinensis]|uniref:palmitoyl-protein hydrolase n=1 Tax=Anopheles sinensis TaxID=74873 RepID=A0A084W6V5_ANOSI|nr:hypothetical protein ZHAS_00013915 [Anopheles sinensis]